MNKIKLLVFRILKWYIFLIVKYNAKRSKIIPLSYYTWEYFHLTIAKIINLKLLYKIITDWFNKNYVKVMVRIKVNITLTFTTASYKGVQNILVKEVDNLL